MRSTKDAISLALHSSLDHLDNEDTYVRLLLIDYGSAFNTNIPSRLISKLHVLGLSFALCNWVLSFLTHRLQSVRIGCVLSPLLYSLYTYDCVAKFQTNAIYKFAENILGQIPNNDEIKYRREIEGLVIWCSENNLSVNVSKTKELIIDFRKKGGEHAPTYVNRTEVERVKNIKFLRVTITNNLSWAPYVNATVKKQKIQKPEHAQKQVQEQVLSGYYQTVDWALASNNITCNVTWKETAILIWSGLHVTPDPQ
eukprot:g34495.t1